MQTGTGESEILILQCAGSRYGLPVAQVSEVVRAVAVSPVPAAPPALIGIIDVRGTVVAVFSLRRLLKLPPADVHPSHQFVIVACHGNPVALHVDQAIELSPVVADHDRIVGDVEADGANLAKTPLVAFVAKTAGGLVPVLSCENLIDSRDLKTMQTTASSTIAESRR